MCKRVDSDLWRHNERNGCSLHQQCVWKQSCLKKHLDTSVAKGKCQHNVTGVSGTQFQQCWHFVDIHVVPMWCHGTTEQSSGTGACSLSDYLADPYTSLWSPKGHMNDRFTSLLFNVNWSSHSWDTSISKFDLENLWLSHACDQRLRPHCWLRPINLLPFHFT